MRRRGSGSRNSCAAWGGRGGGRARRGGHRGGGRRGGSFLAVAGFRPVPMRMDDKKLALLEERVQILKRVEKDADQRKTYDEVFDQATLMAVYKLISDGTIATVDYPVSTGKEGNVFHATTRTGGAALKIYRVNTATFRSLAEYLRGDPRFKKIGRTFREMVTVWAQKEFKNLQRMREAAGPRPPPAGGGPKR